MADKAGHFEFDNLTAGQCVPAIPSMQALAWIDFAYEPSHNNRCVRAEDTRKEHMPLNSTRFQLRVACLVTFGAVLLLSGASANSQVVTDIHDFAGTNDLAYPEYAVPSQGRDGALYGTTTFRDGAVYRFSVGGTLKALETFSYYQVTGTQPAGSLTLASDGTFYGAAFGGGTTSTGVVFKIAPDGSYTPLHEFNSDGAFPIAPPIQATDGNFYGTTLLTTYISSTYGTVYKVTNSGVFSTIYTLDSTHGTEFTGPLVQGLDGNLYGTSISGGAYSCGTLLELTTTGTVLQYYSFPCGATAYPVGPLIQATDGNFYGTTSGDETSTGNGTVFKMTPEGNVSVLYTFLGGPGDGQTPESGLTEGTDRNLYGTTYLGGTFGYGTIFRISPSGDYALLYSFPSAVGANPYAAPTQHTSGMFYGTTNNGGAKMEGSLYSLDMSLGPFIALVRYSGRIGQPLQILGQGLRGCTSVTINGIPAKSFHIVSDTYMTALVPAGATSGPVMITTPTGTLISNRNFQLLH